MRTSLSLLIVFGSILSAAAFLPKSRTHINNNVSKTDTVRYSVEMEDEESFDEEHEEEDIASANINSISYHIPAYSYYEVWDTVKINPYTFDHKNPSTTTLVLKDEYNCDYVPPITNNRITSKFGVRKNRFHYGIDIDLETGDPVRAAFEGTVRVARVASGYGNVVVIRHNNGLETLYGHLSKIDVQIGQHLEAGEVLGLGGNTGRSSGSHLHFEVRFKGEPIDPSHIISFSDKNLLVDKLEITNATFKYIQEYKADLKKRKYYTIKRGDSLSKIARRYGTTTKKLCKINKIKTTTVLRAGRKLRLA